MNAETTSPVGTRIARAQGRLSSASGHREASGAATLREASTALSALIVNTTP